MSIDDSISNQTEAAYHYHNQYVNSKKFNGPSQSPAAMMEDSSKIFELINKLNDNLTLNNSESNQQPDIVTITNKTTPTTNNINLAEPETNEISKNLSNNDIQSLRLSDATDEQSITRSSNSFDKLVSNKQQPIGCSRIPRIPHLHERRQSATRNSITETASILSIREHEMPTTTATTTTTAPQTETSNMHVIRNQLARPSKMRAPRSLSKSSSANHKSSQASATAAKVETTTSSPREAAATVSAKKTRGVSLVMNRELSFASSANNNSIENLSESVCSGNGINGSLSGGNSSKTVKYVIKHKPRESKVKIFSQKLDVSTVSSKIGSLEKAATYKPNGGNVKIESHKLTWTAEPKIGSLEKANHKPAGGNVKIQNFKVDFSKRAKPRTDTGLMVIEVDDANEHLNRSQNSSIDQLNRSEYSLNGSN